MEIAQIIKKLDLKIPSQTDRVLINTNTPCKINMKRDDLIHPIISGNKWRKLKYYLKHYYEANYKSIISFGGAYSNHLYALSHVCHKLKIPLTLMVRGDGYDPTNSTLYQLKENGSKLIFIDRKAYRSKLNAPVVKDYLSGLDRALVIPEGGSGLYSKKGLYELCDEFNWSQIDHLFVSAGTGATAAAIYTYIHENNIDAKLHVVSALKGDFMGEEINAQLKFKANDSLVIYNNYHFGGYAKMPEELIIFEKQFRNQSNIQLDLIYNAKTMSALFDLINQEVISSSDQIMFLNTGGLRK